MGLAERPVPTATRALPPPFLRLSYKSLHRKKARRESPSSFDRSSISCPTDVEAVVGPATWVRLGLCGLQRRLKRLWLWSALPLACDRSIDRSQLPHARAPRTSALRVKRERRRDDASGGGSEPFRSLRLGWAAAWAADRPERRVAMLLAPKFWSVVPGVCRDRGRALR